MLTEILNQVSNRCNVIIVIILYVMSINAFPNQGKWDFTMNTDRQAITIPKSLRRDSQIYVQIVCDSLSPKTRINITWILWQTACWEYYPSFLENVVPNILNDSNQVTYGPFVTDCSDGGHIPLPTVHVTEPNSRSAISCEPHMDANGQQHKPGPECVNEDSSITKMYQQNPGVLPNSPVFKITKDGIYMYTLTITPTRPPGGDFNASIHIEIRSPYGFLSAADYPLLPFYGIMCVIYVIFGVIWLVISFAQWRDLLRIQFWIGGVILLGMLEKAVFYAEYQSINMTGVSVQGAVLMAEWVSCAKRTLARMLVIIVSLGFGIVKPRLGPMLHRVVGVGVVYFVLACTESYLRVMHTKDDVSNQFVASIPLVRVHFASIQIYIVI